MSLFSELSRRNVVRVAIAYFAAVWLLLQVADMMLAAFDAPQWILRALIFACIIGLPIALLLAWHYELTPDGGVQATSARGSARSTKFLGRKLDFGIIGALVLALGILIVDAYILEDQPDSGAALAQQTSIAVLPFINLTSDPENEYFCDGMSEEILNLLARVTNLKVIGRTSSFAYKDRNEDLRDIGAALGVTTLLEGSVRKDGNDVRITAQLIDASDGTHIWSQTYDETLTDVFAVQDAVAASIIDALQIVVGDVPTRGRPTESSAAYELFLKGRALLNVYELQEAEQAVLEALELDPGFAEGHELLARVYWGQAGLVLPAQAAQLRMGETAATALAMDPGLVLASALRQSGNPQTYNLLQEIEAFEVAARAEPENALVLEALVFNLRKAGYLEEALVVAERLLAADPLSVRAQGRRNATLLAVGRTCEGLANLSTASAEHAAMIVNANISIGRDEVALESMEGFLAEFGFTDLAQAASLINGARDPVMGLENLERTIAEIVVAVAEPRRRELERQLSDLYLVFGFLDKYYDLIFGYELSDSAWTDADDLIDNGITYSAVGFTSHPRYVELAERVGMTATWDERGPPDYCSVETGNWVCESIEAEPVSACP